MFHASAPASTGTRAASDRSSTNRAMNEAMDRASQHAGQAHSLSPEILESPGRIDAVNVNSGVPAGEGVAAA
jgi:hypothetical protein